MNGIAYFEIHVDRPEVVIEFYTQAFGWQFTREEGLPIPYWRIETPGIRGGLLQRPVPVPPLGSGTNAFICSVEVEDFDTVTAAILRLGGQVALPKFAVPGVCWHGYFIDPAGNTFGMFQPDESAA